MSTTIPSIISKWSRSFDVRENGHSISAQDVSSVTNSKVGTISAPNTPPGLRPRAPLAEIRNILRVPDLLPLSDTNEQTLTVGGLPLLPPRIVALSPRVSNSSFYSSHDDTRIAASPNLAAPTTAVGALVAQSHGKSVSFVMNEDKPVLPPRRFWFDDSDDDVQYHRLKNERDGQNDTSFDQSYWLQSDSSVDSETGLVDNAPQRYNFDPILQLNVSAISGSMTDYSSVHSLERDEDVNEQRMQLRKRWNQQGEKERLILDCVSRMNGHSYLWAPLDVALLSGFSESRKKQLHYQVMNILRELDTAQPEEFFLSPTQLEQYGATHSVLKRALQFIMKIICLEANDCWELNYEFQTNMEAMPESPATVRGGDTSLFTLPEETATPHMSNMSVATTITSKPLTPDDHDATVSFRKAISITTSIFYKLSLACISLSEPHISAQTSVRATEDIKSQYLALLDISHSDLIEISDAFYISMPLLRTVSLEDDGPSHGMQRSLNLLPAFNDPAIQIESNRIDMDEDDLRRMIGSGDYDCSDVRDDPEGLIGDTDVEYREFYHQPCKV